jgi:hypothetical protein
VPELHGHRTEGGFEMIIYSHLTADFEADDQNTATDAGDQA